MWSICDACPFQLVAVGSALCCAVLQHRAIQTSLQCVLHQHLMCRVEHCSALMQVNISCCLSSESDVLGVASVVMTHLKLEVCHHLKPAP